MGEAQRRHGFVFIGKFPKCRKNLHQFSAHQLQSFAHQNHIGIIAHITAGGT